MGPRQAFRIFIRHQLNTMNEEGYIVLPDDEVEKLADFIENDFSFYEGLSEMLVDYIDDLESDDSELI